VSESGKLANRQIARAAGTVMFAVALSQVAGLVKTILVSPAFGTSAAYDAFNSATRFQDIIFNLVAGGALASAFVPTFTGFLNKDDQEGAWRLASAIINLILLVLTTLSLLSILFAPQIVRTILAPLFPASEQALTVQLLRILMVNATIFGVSGLIMGILNSYQRFLLPAMASSMYWVGMIIGLLVFVPSMGIYGLAWGAVLGAILHLSVQLPDLFHLPGRHYTPSLGLQNPSVREVAVLMGPRLFGVAIIQLNFLVNNIIASGQPTGSVSSIGYAFQIMTVPLYVIGGAIGTATLPTFSRQTARREFTEMRQSLTASLRGVLLLALPSTLGLILLRQPIIAFLFQHKNFDAHSTAMVAWALMWYTVGLVFHSVTEILSRAFYAMHDTRTPVLVTGGSMGLNILFSLAFSAWFTKIGWMPLGGLALATSVAAAIEATLLLILMRKKLNGILAGQLVRGAGAATLGTLVMSAGLVGWLQLIHPSSLALTSLGGVVVGVAIYGVVMMLLRISEVKSLFGTLRQRLGRH
jgi:putative peptidoglycan lipid II flippase